jgi:hypothetical protein
LTNICRPVVTAHVEDYCEPYINTEVENRINQRIGDISNFCGGDVDLTKIAVYLGNIYHTCAQTQNAALNTSNVCEMTQNTCSPNQTVHCPDFQPMCAKWVKRRRKFFVVDSATGKRVPVVDNMTFCVKWVKPAVIPVP